MKGKSIYVAFVDFHKASDSVDCCILHEVLHRKCVIGKLSKAIQSIYSYVQGYVMTSQGYTHTFSCPIHIICYVY